MNADGDQIAGLKQLFKDLGKKNPKIKLIVKPVDGDNIYKLKVKKKNTDIILFEGEMVKRENDDEFDPNVGNYATFVSKTEAGLLTIQNLINEGNGNKGFYGFQTLVQHKRVETQLRKGFRLVSVTGVGPDDGGGDGGDNNNNEENIIDFIGGLATRFALYSEDEEVARCHLTYQDGSWDKSMGPTIEMISVKQPRRGEGLAKLLYYWVNIFIEENFMLECLNNDTPPGHIMVKATQLSTIQVETRAEEKNSSNMIPVGFKELLYDYCGFSVREQKGMVNYMMGGNRPKDEEAVKYIPLLTREELSSRTHDSLVNQMPKIGKGYMRAKNGKRICMYCSRVGSNGMDLLRCNKCGVAFYCNVSCQRNDWKRHKKWCGKSREKVRKKMIEEGLMVEGEDGRDIVMC